MNNINFTGNLARLAQDFTKRGGCCVALVFLGLSAAGISVGIYCVASAIIQLL